MEDYENTPKTETAISKAIQHLEKQTASVDAASEALITRIKTVLAAAEQPKEPTIEGVPGCQPSCDLEKAINITTQRLSVIAERLQYTANRIQL